MEEIARKLAFFAKDTFAISCSLTHSRSCARARSRYRSRSRSRSRSRARFLARVLYLSCVCTCTMLLLSALTDLLLCVYIDRISYTDTHTKLPSSSGVASRSDMCLYTRTCVCTHAHTHTTHTHTHQVAIFVWCSLSFCSFVVPVKVTAHLGAPVRLFSFFCFPFSSVRSLCPSTSPLTLAL